MKHFIKSKTAKVAEETSVEVDDVNRLKHILSELGFQLLGETRKERISFSWENVHVDIDTYPGVPTYLEIEAPDEKTLEVYVKKLGYAMKDTKPWGSKKLYEHYGVPYPGGGETLPRV